MIDLPPDVSWQAAFAQGMAAHRAGDKASARRLFRFAADHGADATPPRMLALLLAEDGDTEQAVRWARRALALDPQSAHSHAALGRVLLRAGQAGMAEQAFQDALALDPQVEAARSGLTALGEAQHRLGQALFRARRWDDAVTALAVASRHLPQNPAVWHDLGTALNEGGDLARAVTAYERALSLAPEAAETWHNLGSVRQAMRDMDGAIAAYARAYALRPESFPRIAQELAAGNPGRVWLRAGDLRRTLASLGARPSRA